jgi:hypothetical protein
MCSSHSPASNSFLKEIRKKTLTLSKYLKIYILLINIRKNGGDELIQNMSHIYTWKYHNETLCIDNLNKNVFFQKQRTVGQTGSVCGLVPVGGGRR